MATAVAVAVAAAAARRRAWRLCFRSPYARGIAIRV
jgi:hypothetical protein